MAVTANLDSKHLLPLSFVQHYCNFDINNPVLFLHLKYQENSKAAVWVICPYHHYDVK